MSSLVITVMGSAILALLVAGYIGQKYLPAPKPKIVGIDLGTTYSCIGAYHAVSGKVDIIPDGDGHLCIPSVVAYRDTGDVLVGYDAVNQADHNPSNTFYDAKRFIGKKFSLEEFQREASRYPFHIHRDGVDGSVKFYTTHHPDLHISPETIGSEILLTLKKSAEAHFKFPISKAVISVPAEFDEEQRNCTKNAALFAGIEVIRVINEPTAAALAYGLHQKGGAQDVLVVDLGGGTLDVSLLDIQGGMFLTRAMAGNNHLGGQDFNERLKSHITAEVEKKFRRKLEDPEDVQALRAAVENLKINLTLYNSARLQLDLVSLKDEDDNNNNNKRHTNNNNNKNNNAYNFELEVTRDLFEKINRDLFERVIEPIKLVLEAGELSTEEVEEIVLVGGSTRIPKVRQLVSEYFNNKQLNVAIDPELAVVTGVSIQAGIVGGAWPLSVSAVESKTSVKKLYVR
ncbi:hypothetical protein HELRODRAFT_102143 [Helobdella robusta]|uniref:Heat shock 70 kDa protein 13 n=1 Tax=Helobdella robusta TaxID=6412 RepID=T1ED83_HELRO|nr:hypothetical protein HELRODRAFT_102143 [Helobdella robusta]ESN97165.1 hypothetical protein HELRODRAFT_102143 [Helobdella robusta]